MENYQKFIRNFPCFARLNDTEILELAKRMEEVCFYKNDVIVAEGDVVDSFYLIAKGNAEVSVTISAKNVHSRVVATLHAGEAIGLNELGFYSKTGLRTATVVASTAMVTLRVTLDKFKEFLTLFPEVNTAMQQAAVYMLRMKLIKKAQPFAKLSPENLHWLSQRISEYHFKAGEIIFNEKDNADSCYLISEGEVQIYITRFNREKVFAKLKSPALFGEAALMTSLPRNASAKALRPTILLKLEKDDLMALLNKDKTSNVVINELILERARLFHNKNVLVQQHQSDEGQPIITLINPQNDSYYQLSEQGLHVYELLNGKNRMHDMIASLKNYYKNYDPEFVYQLLADLVQGGFATFTAEQAPTKGKVTMLSYDENASEVLSGMHLDVSLLNSTDDKVRWINVSGLQELETLNQLAKKYHLNTFTVEDILNVKHRPKVEKYNDYLLIILKSLVWDRKHHKIQAEQVSIVLTEKAVFSFMEKDSDLFDVVFDFFHTRQGKNIRSHSTDYLFYLLLDAIVEQYFKVLEALSTQIEKSETFIVANPALHDSSKLYRFKRQLVTIHKIIWSTRDVIKHTIDNHTEKHSGQTATMYLKELYDRTNEAMDTLSNLQDTVLGMIDVYHSNVSIRMNETVKVLTIISTIFMPIATIAGIFGMAFYNMPFIYSYYGFYIMLGLMLVVTSALIFYYKWRGWI